MTKAAEGYLDIARQIVETSPKDAFLYVEASRGLYTSLEGTVNLKQEKSIEFNDENIFENFEDHAYFSFIFERPEYVDFIYIFKGIFCIMTLFFFHFVKKNVNLRVGSI